MRDKGEEEGGEKVQRRRRGEERRGYFLDVQSRAVRLLGVSIRAGLEMAAAAAASSLILHFFTHRCKIACVSSPWRSSPYSYQMMLRQTHTHAYT